MKKFGVNIIHSLSKRKTINTNVITMATRATVFTPPIHDYFEYCCLKGKANFLQAQEYYKSV